MDDCNTLPGDEAAVAAFYQAKKALKKQIRDLRRLIDKTTDPTDLQTQTVQYCALLSEWALTYRKRYPRSLSGKPRKGLSSEITRTHL